MRERAIVVLCAALAVAPLAALGAQNADSMLTMRAEDVLQRVRRYTTSDVGVARHLADSLVRVLPADASVMPEALFAKASIAPSASDAERDYSRIVNEYRFANRVPDALMRLALLESARNNRAGALRHLDRLLRDHGQSQVRSRASLMAGRLRLEMNDPARGCELLAAAWASAGQNERDVRDQAETLGAKCPTNVAERAKRDPAPLGILRAPSESAATPVVLGTAQTAAARRRQRDSVLAAQAARAAARRDSIARVAAVPRPVVRRDTAPPRPPATVVRRDTVPSAPVVRRDTAPTPAPAEVRRDTAPTPRRAPPVAVVRRDTAPTPRPVPPVAVVRRDTAPTPRPAPPAVRTEPTADVPAAATRFAVQFAAYNDRPGAEQFAAVLQGRGITARVEGTEKPFRVRAGRFRTRAEAEASAALWRRPGQAAIVVAYP
ncbi:MAG: SPOR domain-containing protein [Gemmatimonadota bacterium]